MSHIFISYQGDDSDFADKVCTKLRTKKIPYWIAKTHLQGGDPWQPAIDTALREAFAVIVVMSPAAKASEYVAYEWSFALGADKLVIPLLRIKTPLHPRLAQIQYEDFTGSDSDRGPWQSLLKRVRKARGETQERWVSDNGDARAVRTLSEELRDEIDINRANLRSLVASIRKAAQTSTVESVPLTCEWADAVWSRRRDILSAGLAPETARRVRDLYTRIKYIATSIAHIAKEQANHRQAMLSFRSQPGGAMAESRALSAASMERTRFITTVENSLVRTLLSDIAAILAQGNPLDDADAVVLEIAGDVAIEKGHPFIATTELAAAAQARSLTDSMMSESLLALREDGCIDQYVGHSFHLTFLGIEQYIKRHVPDDEAITMAIARCIVKEGKTMNVDIAGALTQPLLVVTHILDRLKRDNLVGQVSHLSDGTAFVQDPSVKLKRLVDQSQGSP